MIYATFLFTSDISAPFVYCCFEIQARLNLVNIKKLQKSLNNTNKNCAIVNHGLVARYEKDLFSSAIIII